MRAATFLTSAVCLCIAYFAIHIQTQGFQVFTYDQLRREKILETPSKIPDLIFENHKGEQVFLSDFQGQFIIVDFIYTSCQTICNSLGLEFARIQKEAEALIMKGDLHLLSVSFDSKRDDAPALKSYLDKYSQDESSWSALRFSREDDMPSFIEKFGVIVIQDENNEFIHNGALHLISPDGKLIAITDYFEAELLIDSINQKINNEVIL